MRISGSCARAARAIAFVAVLAVALAGCESKQDKALDQAKKQAAATGQPQQVVTVEKDGSTVTTVVQPPAQGSRPRQYQPPQHLQRRASRLPRPRGRRCPQCLLRLQHPSP